MPNFVTGRKLIPVNRLRKGRIYHLTIHKCGADFGAWGRTKKTRKPAPRTTWPLTHDVPLCPLARPGALLRRVGRFLLLLPPAGPWTGSPSIRGLAFGCRFISRRYSVDVHERAAGRWAVSSFPARLRSLTVPAAAVYRQEPPTLEIVDEQKSSHSRLAFCPR
jgi:hypothetical protein